MLDLHCGAWALQLRHLGLVITWHVDLSFPIRDWTQVPCTGRRILNTGHTGPPGKSCVLPFWVSVSSSGKWEHHRLLLKLNYCRETTSHSGKLSVTQQLLLLLLLTIIGNSFNSYNCFTLPFQSLYLHAVFCFHALLLPGPNHYLLALSFLLY